MLAIRKELAAIRMYSQLTDAAEDAAEKSLIMELASREPGHKFRLDDIYVNMAFREAF